MSVNAAKGTRATNTTMRTAQLYRSVQLTARSSALLFAGAQATSALGPRAWWLSRPLYLVFMAVHAVHFTVVARYAVVNGGRDLFPGGRSLSDVGGWPTVAGIYTLFAGLTITGWVTGGARVAGRPALGLIGNLATSLIAAMFVGVYAGQLRRSRWYAVPATAVAGSVAASLLAERVRGLRPAGIRRGRPLRTWDPQSDVRRLGINSRDFRQGREQQPCPSSP